MVLRLSILVQRRLDGIYFVSDYGLMKQLLNIDLCVLFESHGILHLLEASKWRPQIATPLHHTLAKRYRSNLRTVKGVRRQQHPCMGKAEQSEAKSQVGRSETKEDFAN